MKLRDFYELAIKYIFMCFTLIGLLGVFSIFIFVSQKGFPLLLKVGFIKFIFGTNWQPTGGHFGIFPLILGSLIVTSLSLVGGGTLGILTGIFFAEIAPDKIKQAMRPFLELLAGIPSVVYGLFGFLVIIPLINKIDGPANSGFGILSASIILSIMILPTVATITEDAIGSIPNEFRLASYAISGTRWQTIIRVVLPASKSGLLTAIILGTGRAIGETMAVLMLIGNPAIIPNSIFSKAATMTSIIAIDMSYASGDHRASLFAIAVILFALVFSLLLVANKFGDQRRW